MENDHLYVSAPEVPKTLMKAVTTTDFDVKAVQAKVTFMVDSGRVNKMNVNMNGGERFIMKIPAANPANVNLQGYFRV
jgi:hypothetical protein